MTNTLKTKALISDAEIEEIKAVGAPDLPDFENTLLGRMYERLRSAEDVFKRHRNIL